MTNRSTLMGYTKEQLVDRIECLEHNNAVLTETVDTQYKNATKLLDDMKMFNDTYANAKAHSMERTTTE